MALRGERTVTGKLRRGDCGAHVLKFVACRERTIERNADHNDLKRFRHSLFTFKNHSHVRDAHCLRVDPCMDILKKLAGKLPILVLRSNVPASVVRHDTPGKYPLIRNPTGIETNESTGHLERIISKPNAMHSILVVQVVQNSDCNHNVGIFKSRVALNRSRVANDKSPLIAVGPLGKRDITWVDVEPQIFDVWQTLQNLRRTTPDIHYFIPSSASVVFSTYLPSQPL